MWVAVAEKVSEPPSLKVTAYESTEVSKIAPVLSRLCRVAV